MTGSAAVVAATLALCACGSHEAFAPSGWDYVPVPATPGEGALIVPVPPGFRWWNITDGIHRTGTRAPVSGRVVTNYYRPKPGPNPFLGWSHPSSTGPPPDKVALAVTLSLAVGPVPPAKLHLPLSLDQPWFVQHLKGGARGYRWGYLSFRKRLYEIFFWSGPAAPPHSRTAVLKTLSLIHPAP